MSPCNYEVAGNAIQGEPIFPVAPSCDSQRTLSGITLSDEQARGERARNLRYGGRLGGQPSLWTVLIWVMWADLSGPTGLIVNPEESVKRGGLAAISAILTSALRSMSSSGKPDARESCRRCCDDES